MNRQMIKLYVLSGFLGAGKTTLLNNLLYHNEDKKIGVIVNEFGKESIDGVRISKNGIEMIEINNGSVFCSCLKSSFLDSLLAFSKMPIEFLFIEGSGLADPSNMPEMLEWVSNKTEYQPYQYMGSICIVDALFFLDYHEIFTAIHKQVSSSSVILINKTDLVEANKLKIIKKIIKELNPSTDVLFTSYCKLDFDSLDHRLDSIPTKKSEQSTNTTENRPNSFVLKATGVYSKNDFLDFISDISQYAYRIKGLFCLDDGWKQVDVVGGHVDLKPINNSEDTSKIVIISNIGPGIIRKIFHSWEIRFLDKMTLK